MFILALSKLYMSGRMIICDIIMEWNGTLEYFDSTYLGFTIMTQGIFDVRNLKYKDVVAYDSSDYGKFILTHQGHHKPS